MLGEKKSTNLIRYAINQASCQKFEVKFDPTESMPYLTSQALKQINELSNKNEQLSENDLNKFVDRFGTHIMIGASFGSRVILNSTVDWIENYRAVNGMYEGELVLTDEKGWCDKHSQDGEQIMCQFIQNG